MSTGSDLSFFVGSYTVPTPGSGAPDGHGAGIVHAVLDTATGSLSQRSVAADLPDANPSYLTTSRGQLWAVSEIEREGVVSAFALSAEGEPQLAGWARTGALSPCHIEVDVGMRLAFVCHFHGGRLAVLGLKPDGTPDAVNQLLETPAAAAGVERAGQVTRPHCARRVGLHHLLVTDCGRDFVFLYRIVGCGRDGHLELEEALALPTGSGPRHIALSPGGDSAYISNQTSANVAVVALHGLETTAVQLRLASVAASPGLGRARPFPSEIVAHPNGLRTYMANRRDDSLSVYSVADDGTLTLRETLDAHGVWTRHLCLSPDLRFLLLANQNSNEVVAFRVDESGDLAWANARLPMASPACVVFP